MRKNPYEKNKWFVFRFVLIIVSILFIFMGLMLMDYGASFKDMPIVGQSLVFGSIEPRVMYHMGLFFVILSTLILGLLSSWYLLCEKIKK